MAASKKTGRSRKRPPVTPDLFRSSRPAPRRGVPEIQLTLLPPGCECAFDRVIGDRPITRLQFLEHSLVLGLPAGITPRWLSARIQALLAPPCVRSGLLAEDSRPAAPQALKARSQAKRGSKPLSTGVAGGQTAGEATASEQVGALVTPPLCPMGGTIPC